MRFLYTDYLMSCYVPGCKILTICFAGAKVHQSQECTRIIEPGGVSYTLESVGGIEGATHNMKPLLEHAQNLYKQCVHLERVMNREEANSNEGQYFPFIVCRKPPASRTVPKGGDVHNEAQNSRYGCTMYAVNNIDTRSVVYTYEILHVDQLHYITIYFVFKLNCFYQYSQLLPCGHSAITDAHYYGQNPDLRLKL